MVNAKGARRLVTCSLLSSTISDLAFLGRVEHWRGDPKETPCLCPAFSPSTVRTMQRAAVTAKKLQEKEDPTLQGSGSGGRTFYRGGRCGFSDFHRTELCKVAPYPSNLI